MSYMRHLGFAAILGTGCVFAAGCGAGSASEEQADSVTSEIVPGQCNQAQPKDILIAQLVKDSWVASYPLTRLSVDSTGAIVGLALPDVMAGDVDLINAVPEARASVATALSNLTGLPDYGMNGIGPDTNACTSIPAWTPSGSTTVNTVSNEVFPVAPNADSWREVQKQFSKECPLVKRLGNHDIIDPPGDGSTNLPPSQTVSSTGVTANAFGLCPTGTYSGTFCKLSSGSGINYTGRSCQYYYGSLRCLLY
jgi:hypothetical protein